VTATVRASLASNSSSTSTTTFTPTLPAGVVAGDLLIGIAVGGDGATPTGRPSGSTSRIAFADSTLFQMDIVTKTAAGADVLTWTVTTARKWAGGIVAITTGTWDTVTPITGAAGLAKGATVDTAFATPSATPGNADSLIIAILGAQLTSTWSTADASPAMTEVIDTTASSTAPASCGVYRSNTPPAVSAITRNATAIGSSANGGGGIMFVNPAAVATVVRLPRRYPAQYRR
jgi:hypothetical protein